MSIPTQPAREQAEETLAYIRETMESASTFTGVSGWGLVGVGGIGLIASWLSWATCSPEIPCGTPAFLRVWVPAALAAVAVAAVANVAKARRLEIPLWTGSLRKMAWGLAPALAAGAFLTQALTAQEAPHLLPGTWLALYGAGVTASGTFSVQAVRWMGLAMLALGSLALLLANLGLVLLAVGFGGVHVAFGLYIAQQHGG